MSKPQYRKKRIFCIPIAFSFFQEFLKVFSIFIFLIGIIIYLINAL